MWEGGLRVPMVAAGPAIPKNSQCDTPVAQWDYLTTFHDLSGSAAPLPDDLDGVSLRPVLENGNAGQLAQRDTGLVFHFPAYYTVPITAYRDGDFKLMRHLNTGEIKLFNVAQDMGESQDLSKSMPEKTASMIARLDAYLETVGAWTMEEVYETRQEELRNWIARHHRDIAEINQGLASNPGKVDLVQRLKKVRKDLERHQATLEKVTSNQHSARWF